mmetsp:Transcript_81081/g.234479  ORF Transcript_81081/g.234479 Transcript_81081/m.234479 type:complete len:394 (-) Transcript_81081:79-1260(-)
MSRIGSSALVNVTEDAELRLVRHLAEAAESTSKSFVNNCEACISRGDAAKLMEVILEEKAVIQALSLDDEAVSAVSLLAALLDRTKDSQLVQQLADSLIQVSTDTTKTISLLATLYNMRSDALEKVSLMVKMIRLASKGEPSLLDPHSSDLGKWIDASHLAAMMDEWCVEPAARRALYIAASEGASTPLAKQRFMLLVLETYSATDLDAQALQVAEQAAMGVIRDPISLFEQQRHVLTLPAIQALQEKSPHLLELLNIVQEGKLEDYYSFIQSNGGVGILQQWEGVTPENCVRYMRILSLCSVASAYEEIPYQVVADTLQTNLKDVEMWVIAAVSSGLLTAKMDQLQGKVVVERCVVRKFDMDQWKSLKSRLDLWRQNVGHILDAYRQNLQSQ